MLHTKFSTRNDNILFFIFPCRCDVNDIHILPNSPICINVALEESHNLPVTLKDIATNHDFVENDVNYSTKEPHIQNTLVIIIIVLYVSEIVSELSAVIYLY